MNFSYSAAATIGFAPARCKTLRSSSRSRRRNVRSIPKEGEARSISPTACEAIRAEECIWTIRASSFAGGLHDSGTRNAGSRACSSSGASHTGAVTAFAKRERQTRTSATGISLGTRQSGQEWNPERELIRPGLRGIGRRRRTRTFNLRLVTAPTLSRLSYPPDQTLPGLTVANRKQS